MNARVNPDDVAPYEFMGPTLLSEQALMVEGKPYDPGQDWEEIYTHCETTLARARTDRTSWWTHWNRLAEYFQPRRSQWTVVANKGNKGSAINDTILDATGTLALKTCASGMWAGFTNPSRPWLKLEPKQPGALESLDAEGKEWLDQTAEVLYTIFAGSNFYTIMAEAFGDLALFGTAPVLIYEDYEEIIRCYLPCAGEYFLKVGARFSTDTFLREFVLTIQQVVEMFSIENCPPEIQTAWMNGGAELAREVIVAHIIEPNFPIKSRGARKRGLEGAQAEVRPVAKAFDYREVYWLRGEKGPRPLSKRGFSVRPFFAMMWSRRSNDPYGRSACMDALGDNKQVQRQTLRKGEFIEKLVRPPMGADPMLRNEPSSILPGMTNYISTEGGKKGFWPLFEMQPAALTPLTEDIKSANERIERALFVDVFMAITQMEGVQPRNELELTKRDLERLQKLGPVIDLVENELTKAVLRVIDIAERRKLLRPVPNSLRNTPLKVTFETLMRLAQRQAASVAMKDVFQTMGELSAAAKAGAQPDPLRVLNLDKSARKYADLNNFPSDCVFTEDEVKKHDAARAQEIKAAQQPQALMAGVQAAKTLSETNTGGQNALAGLMGGAGGGLGGMGGGGGP